MSKRKRIPPETFKLVNGDQELEKIARKLAALTAEEVTNEHRSTAVYLWKMTLAWAYYGESKNPVWAWWAWSVYRRANLPIPGWVLEYLDRAAFRIGSQPRRGKGAAEALAVKLEMASFGQGQVWTRATKVTQRVQATERVIDLLDQKDLSRFKACGKVAGDLKLDISTVKNWLSEYEDFVREAVVIGSFRLPWKTEGDAD